MENSIASINLESKGSSINLERVVKQGDLLSPMLFNCVLQIIYKDLEWGYGNKGININGKDLNNLRFADDVVLISESVEVIETMLNDLQQQSLKRGL